jgi:hypothetical protein
LIYRKQKKILRRRLRQVENLRSTKEEMVYICELEDREILSEEEEISAEDLIYF